MKIIMTDMDGKDHELEATEEWTLMEIIREGGVPILAQCGGSCACATCHVYLDPAWKAKVPEPTEEEIAMLDSAFDVTPDSRLACQIVFTKDLDGLKVRLAAGSI